MSILPRLAVFLLAIGLALPATAGVTEDERARNAVRVLEEIQAIPESGIPDVLFDEARAIVVVPDTLKIGLVIGGRRGLRWRRPSQRCGAFRRYRRHD